MQMTSLDLYKTSEEEI